MLASLVRGVLLASPCSMTSFIVGLRPRLAGTIATARDVVLASYSEVLSTMYYLVELGRGKMNSSRAVGEYRVFR
jgi:hypothetical protein